MKLVTPILLALLLAQFASAQGSINGIDTITGHTAAGNNAVGFRYSSSDNPVFNVAFTTGNNADGYIFNSVSLFLAATVGSPNTFLVYIEPTADDTYAPTALGGRPLNGSDNPTTAGTYTYAPNSGDGFTLAAETTYYIVVEGSPLGDIEWSYANSVGGMATTDGWSIGGYSNFGPDLNPIYGIPMFSLNSTPIPTPTPEPGTLAMAALGSLGGLLAYRRKQSKL